MPTRTFKSSENKEQGGLAGVHTRRLIERTILRFPERVRRFKRFGLPAKRGIILKGPPGTGKTMVCRAICNELKATFVWMTARHAQDDAVAFAAVWDLARRLQPTVVLLEDIDLYAESRDTCVRSNMLGELMNQMDGVEPNDGILTIATTNRLEVVENALRNRPGRFDRTIHLGELEQNDRRTMLGDLLHGGLEPDVLCYLMSATDGFTGAQIIELAKSLIDQVDEGGTDDPDCWRITEATAKAAVAEMKIGPMKRSIGFVEAVEVTS